MRDSSELAPPSRNARLALAVIVLAAAGLLAFGADKIPGEAGYLGIGANFLPWVVAVAMAVCGLALGFDAWRDAHTQTAAPPKCWAGFACLSIGMLCNAALISHIGFILSCALCFAWAALGWRIAEDKPRGVATVALDVVIGAAIAAPVFWIFTKGLGVALPALLAGSWI